VGTTDRFFFTPDEASVISFLQIIAKFLTIFSFEFEVVIVGKISKLLRDAVKKVGFKTTSEQGEFSWIEFRLQDGLGRSWAGPRMWHEMKAGVVTGSLFYSLERFVALLVERNEGELPVEQPCRKENVLVSL
jgi:threonyl-tRNA synthetase